MTMRKKDIQQHRAAYRKIYTIKLQFLPVKYCEQFRRNSKCDIYKDFTTRLPLIPCLLI